MLVLPGGCRSEDEAPADVTIEPRPPAPGQTSDRSSDLCRLVGPDNNQTGLYGSDLGYTVSDPADPSKLRVLFGDTWAKVEDACAYPVAKADDLQARLPAQAPASPVGQANAGAAACSGFEYALDDPSDPASWRRISLYDDTAARTATSQLDTGMLRTPVAAASDGQRVIGFFTRQEPAYCASSAECPTGMACSADPAYSGRAIGGCQPAVALTTDTPPTLCLVEAGCAPPTTCAPLERGICVATEPFKVAVNERTISPPWYQDDPRRAVAAKLRIGVALWPDRPEDYGTGFVFVTNKFTNPAVRTVANFDFEDPSKNDYRPGNHTLLMWGRPGGLGGSGFQALMFLLAQPLEGLIDPQGSIRWQPRFFAGYDAAGDPVWSNLEADAQPVYGLEGNIDTSQGEPRFDWKDPEYDYINQMTISWVAPLSRWVMFYGGSAPAWLAADRARGTLTMPTYKQPIEGAIYMRSAAHPWGRARASSPAADAWTPARPVLTRERAAKYLACDDDAAEPRGDCMGKPDPNRPNDLLGVLGTLAASGGADPLTAAAQCLAGDVALTAQYMLGDDSAGHLYGVNIIDAWTADVTRAVGHLAPHEKAVDVYWNVSTWNPYQVVMFKTQLRGHAADVY